MRLKANGVLEVTINWRSAEVVLLKEHVREGRCALRIQLIKEGLLLDDIDSNELLIPLKAGQPPQLKKVLGDTISAQRIDKAHVSVAPTIGGPIQGMQPEQPKKRGCAIF